MSLSLEEELWMQTDFTAFDKLPRNVRDVIRYHQRKIDVRGLKKVAKTEAEMLDLLANDTAPIRRYR